MKYTTFTILLCLFSLSVFAQKDKAVYSTKSGAIKGYDPVAYFTQNQAIKGKEEISFEWNDATWHFASEEHRKLFQEQPEKYAPQYGGWCAYGWSQGYPYKVDPKAWTIFDDKLYLNYNKKIQQSWSEKQSEYISTADKNYAKAHQ